MPEPSQAAGPKAWPATPLRLKREDFEWPEGERMFYLLSSAGLFICRNHEFFRSCVPAPRGPSELEPHEPSLECRFPLIPQRTFERIVGFFDCIRRLHNSEASVLLAYDRTRKRVRIVVPEQTATVVRYSDGYQYPVGLHYFPPTNLPQDWVLFGDVHSHVDMSAYSSGVDVEDELHSAGLHIVVGRLSREPMECHVEAVVDGARFALTLEDVVAGYGARSQNIPPAWIERVQVEAAPAWPRGTGTSYGTGEAGSGGATS